jgi:hypothetical protein
LWLLPNLILTHSRDVSCVFISIDAEVLDADDSA